MMDSRMDSREEINHAFIGKLTQGSGKLQSRGQFLTS